MVDETKLRRQLRTNIRARRSDIDEYLAYTRPRRNTLTNISIFCSALAALFSAAPGFSGPGGVAALAHKVGAQPAQVWQSFCIAAFVSALAATVTVNMNRSYDLPARVTAAEACQAGLDSLLAHLEFDDLSVHDAVEDYEKYLQQIPFVPQRQPTSMPPRSGAARGQ